MNTINFKDMMNGIDFLESVATAVEPLTSPNANGSFSYIWRNRTFGVYIEVSFSAGGCEYFVLRSGIEKHGVCPKYHKDKLEKVAFAIKELI